MRKTNPPSLVTLAVLTTITILSWVFFDIYRTLKKPPVIDIDSKILESFSPNLDLDLLTEIKERKFFDEESLIKITTATEEGSLEETGKIE